MLGKVLSNRRLAMHHCKRPLTSISRGLKTAFESAGTSAASMTKAVIQTTTISIPDTEQKPKWKPPHKRASVIIHNLRRREHEKAKRMNEEKHIPRFEPGDAIEVKMLSHLSNKVPDTHRGVVIGINRSGVDTMFALIDVVAGTPIKNTIPLYSPFITSIKILQKAYIHKGKKRVRRAKLNYLWNDRDPREYSIST